MRPLKIKDRCTKKRLSKCKEMARLYDKIQIVYASVLEADKRIESIMCTIRTDRRGYSFFIRTGEKETYIGFGSNAGLSTEQTMEHSFTGTVFSAFCINGTAALTSFDVEVLPDSTLQDVQ